MARKLTPAIIARIQARKQDGLTHTQLVDEFGLSLGSISAALKMRGAAADDAPRPVLGPPPEIDTEPAADPIEEIRTTLRTIARSLQQVGEAARAKGDTGVYLQYARAATAAFKELGRFTPPKPPDENDDPDMVEAARKGREKILEKIRRRAAKTETG